MAKIQITCKNCNTQYDAEDTQSSATCPVCGKEILLSEGRKNRSSCLSCLGCLGLVILAIIIVLFF